jgi:uncharacterized protein YlzI (FlbEa/FlbD family)
MSKTEHLANPLLLLTNAGTGQKVAVSGMWIETIEETEEGTAITFSSSGRVMVQEPFASVVDAFTLQAYRERAKGRSRTP